MAGGLPTPRQTKAGIPDRRSNQMMTKSDIRYANESDKYRAARNELLEAEIGLRRQHESVAALRRQLPLGGKLKEDYVFEEMQGRKIVQTKFSQLFDPKKNTLITYSFMFPDSNGKPCPACTSILDGLNGSAPHIRDKVSYVVIAKAPIKKIMQWAKKRGWDNLRLLSSSQNNFNEDYFSEGADGSQHPLLNVFTKRARSIFHFYGTESYFAPVDKGQNPRHVDLIWPIWQMFDYTPEGRGHWGPQYSYPKIKK
jgi:predicted dithiol-disulfide oxidoreductase (DUF899 family)